MDDYGDNIKNMKTKMAVSKYSYAFGDVHPGKRFCIASLLYNYTSIDKTFFN